MGHYWTPADLPDAVAYWHSTNIAANVHLTGSTIDQVDPAGGLNYPLYGYVDSGGKHYGPTLVDDGNGYKYAQFDANINSLYAGPFSSTSFGPVNNAGISLIGRIDSNSTTYGRLVSVYGGQGQRDYDNLASFNLRRQDNTNGFLTEMNGTYAAQTIPYATIQILENEVWDQNAATILNGGTPVVASTGQTPAINPSEVDWGTRTGGSDQFGGYIGEATVWKRRLTATEHTIWQGYIAGAWGRRALLPANHTYKSASPYVNDDGTITAGPKTTVTASGGGVAGGSAVGNQLQKGQATGGGLASGQATGTQLQQSSASGGGVAGGSASSSSSASSSATGGGQASGTALGASLQSGSASGGGAAGGSATNGTAPASYSAQGGGSSGGSAVGNANNPYTPPVVTAPVVSPNPIFAVEVTAAIDSVGTLKTFYVSSGNLVTIGTDSPANTAFVPALTDPGTFGVALFANGSTTGGIDQQFGQMVLENIDGMFDPWLNYSFDGRPITIRRGKPGQPYPWPAIFTGTIAGITLDVATVNISLKDQQQVFQQGVQNSVFGGTNALPNGVDGTSDLAGKRAPRLLGRCFGIPAPCVNTSLLIYKVGFAMTKLSAVYDNGNALAAGTDYPNNAALQAASLSSGYATCLAEGLFRLGATPAGTVTCDAENMNFSTVADILTQIATQVPYIAGSLNVTVNQSDRAALNSLCPQVVGYWAYNNEKCADVMDALAQSVNAWYFFDGNGVLRMGQLKAPTQYENAAYSLSDIDLLPDFNRAPAESPDTPAWQITLNFAKQWQTLTTFAGAVTVAARNIFSQEYQSAFATQQSVQTQYLLAQQKQLDTLLTTFADAQAEANRRLAIFSTRRSIYTVPIDLDTLPAFPLLGVQVLLTDRRFALNNGKLLRLIGVTYQLAKKQIYLTLWG